MCEQLKKEEIGRVLPTENKTERARSLIVDVKCRR